ncbi:hypothetical protein AAFF_G00214480 [Aldrovandia affinis]|uniref:BPTI/Kunitz inhibitor domain-containing protein n=1 Tax=Aldrovandia affinis TaxID=143900 RepID=A0AAD7W571_9TELE|nr:hypothetical protein AAFF_G00214480 [Aldrovandia affinis]
MEKLALTLLLLTRSQALSEASTDLVGKAFIFPGESLAHVALVPALNNTFLTVTLVDGTVEHMLGHMWAGQSDAQRAVCRPGRNAVQRGGRLPLRHRVGAARQPADLRAPALSGVQRLQLECVFSDMWRGDADSGGVLRGGRAERVQDSACSSLHRPQTVQTCQRPACHQHISWHVGHWGLCTKRCGSGTRERQVICSDRGYNLHGAEHCDITPRPPTVESCNDQPCHSPQMVPSMQDPRGHDLHGYLPYIPGEPSARRPVHSTPPPTTHTAQEPIGPATGPHCSQTYYGCCPDGRTAATRLNGDGCAPEPCALSRFGCCADGVTAAGGPSRLGCPDTGVHTRDHSPSGPEPREACHASTYGCCHDNLTPAAGPQQEGCPAPSTDAHRAACSLPSTVGPCADWTSRYYYDAATSRCVHFWYGGCQGNGNNFLTREECQRSCHGESSQPGPALVLRRDPGTRRVVGTRRMIIVHRGSRQGSSAAANAQRVRAPYHPFRHASQRVLTGAK